MAMTEGYRQLAQDWMRDAKGWELVLDDAIERLPEDRPVWLLGWRNRFLTELVDKPFGLDLAARRFEIDGQVFDGEDTSLALVREVAGRPLGLIAAGSAAAIPGLTRKLPHYGKYGYLAFTGSEPSNRLKGQWPAGESRLQVWFGEERPSLAPLATPPLGSRGEAAPAPGSGTDREANATPSRG